MYLPVKEGQEIQNTEHRYDPEVDFVHDLALVDVGEQGFIIPHHSAFSILGRIDLGMFLSVP